MIVQHGDSASCSLPVEGESTAVRFEAIQRALGEPDTQLCLFGKPEVHGKRRMGVALARAASIEEARAMARRMEAVLQEEVRHQAPEAAQCPEN